jgi:hypothetical protein
MAKLEQALRQIVDVAFYTTKVWEEKSQTPSVSCAFADPLY